MSHGSAKRCQSTIEFPTHSSQPITSLELQERATKRNRTDIEMQINDNNAFNSDSAITLVENVTRPTKNDENMSYTIVKLDRIVAKKNGFQIHKEFLSKCVDQKVIPMGLKIELEPSIGNHDEEFLSKWHKRLEEFSIIMMKDIIEFCEKTETKATNDMQTAQDDVNKSYDESDKKEIAELIKTNEDNRLRNLRSSKQKKFNFLKYKGNSTYKNSYSKRPDPTIQNPRRVPSNVNTGTANKKWSELFKQPSKTNIACKQSFTNNHMSKMKEKDAQKSSIDDKIDNLQNEIHQLKRARLMDNNEMTRDIVAQKNQYHNRNEKNYLPVPSQGRDATNKLQTNPHGMHPQTHATEIQIDEVISFISTTMQTLK